MFSTLLIFRWQEREQRHPVKKPSFQARSFDAYKDHKKSKFQPERRSQDRSNIPQIRNPNIESAKPKGTELTTFIPMGTVYSHSDQKDCHRMSLLDVFYIIWYFSFPVALANPPIGTHKLTNGPFFFKEKNMFYLDL